MTIHPVTDDMLPQYEQFVQLHPKGHFMQSRAWGKVKSDWQWHAFVARNDAGKIIGSMALLIRKLPGLPYTLAYGCRGPVCDVCDTALTTALLNYAKQLARKHKAYLIKLDPDLPLDSPFAAIAESCGFKLPVQSKNFESIQPRFVFRLPLTDKNAETVMAGFHHKWRYNIRLAERKEVTVTVDNTQTAEFSRLMIETGERDGFGVRNEAYFKRMLDELGTHARLYMADIDGEYVAGSLAIGYGDKVWYLYGASDTAHRNYMPSYLLQWHMMQWALARDARLYDFRGVSGDLDENNPLYGLYRFKKGFGGDFTEFAGEFDCVLKPLVNKVYLLGQKVRKKL
ncbi:MAG: peptidoglycan bridge formation glycyltransferase FemA/FemB family protein [Oscillospiraceae bacterium]|nr:peptidoglycan bridge formation glycyltransferase FemA/FemB family protein [Oscillospiraceae bacterium]